MHFQGSLRTLTFEYNLRYIKHNHAIQMGSQRFREGISGKCQLPWSLKQLPWGYVWFPEQQQRMVIKSSGSEARLPEFKPVKVLHSPAVYLGRVAFLGFLLWYYPHRVVVSLHICIKCLEYRATIVNSNYLPLSAFLKITFSHKMLGLAFTHFCSCC